jgi:hypothetical protein
MSIPVKFNLSKRFLQSWVNYRGGIERSKHLISKSLQVFILEVNYFLESNSISRLSEINGHPMPKALSLAFMDLNQAFLASHS